MKKVAGRPRQMNTPRQFRRSEISDYPSPVPAGIQHPGWN
jgi:hypothetical protein